MKRLIGCLAVIAAAACFWQQARADQVVIDDYTWYYEVTATGDDGPEAVSITGVEYDADVVDEPVLEIPDVIEIDDVEVPVTEIADGAFSGNENVTYAYIPSSVEYIGAEAFYDCSALANVEFAEPEIIYAEDYETEWNSFANTLTIGGSAFSGCTALEGLEFPANLAELGDYAFGGCTALEFADFTANSDVGEGSLYIGEGTFSDCTNLQEVIFPEEYPYDEYYDEESEELYGWDGWRLEIGAYAFDGCESLEYFAFPSITSSVGAYAFEGCSALAEVFFLSNEAIREGSLVIGEYAFAGCESLSYVEFADRYAEWFEEYDEEEDEYYEWCECEWYVSIGEGAFSDCPTLEDVYFGVGLCEIGNAAFMNDVSLTNVEFPATLEYIGSQAFGDCENLKDVCFSGYVSVADDAFEGTLYDPEYEEGEFELVIEDNFVVGYIGHINGDDDSEVEIPDGVVGIMSYAFENLEGLTSVTIPASVKKIGYGAFYDCYDLEEVVFEGGMDGVFIGAGAFWGTPFNDGLDFALTICDDVVTGFVGANLPEEIVIPDGVVEIADSAFDFDSYYYGEYDHEEDVWYEWSPMEDVTSITIPASVEKIGMYAFFRSSGLESVKVGNPFVEIDGSSFFGCESLDELTFNYPGYVIDSMTITGYSYKDSDDEDEDEIEGYLPAGMSETVPLDFSLLFNGYEYEGENCQGEIDTFTAWLEYVTVKFNWGALAVADTTSLGVELPSNVVLVVGQKVGAANIAAISEAVEAAAPALHGRSLAGLVDGSGNAITADTVVGDSMSIAADWDFVNPLDGNPDAAVDTSAAQQYNGYVLDGDGNCAGTILVKVGKPNKQGQASVSATLQMMGEKKLTFKAEAKGKAAISAGGSTTNITLVCAKAADDIVIDVSADGVSGTYGAYDIAGSRNTSKKDASSYTPWIGVYEAVFTTTEAEGAGAAFADGYSTVNVSVAAKGKVKVTGTMADGTKVSASSQLLVADNGTEACVNVFAPMYGGKKGGFSFVLWLASNGTATVESVSDWQCTNAKAPFTASVACVDGSKLVAPKGSLKFGLVGDGAAKIADVRAEYLPTSVGVTVNGTKLVTAKANKVKYDKKTRSVVVTGETDNTAGLKLTYTAKTGALKGSFSAYTLTGGKLKKVKANLTGAFVGGKGYGSAVIKNVGSFPFEIK